MVRRDPGDWRLLKTKGRYLGSTRAYFGIALGSIGGDLPLGAVSSASARVHESRAAAPGVVQGLYDVTALPLGSV